MADEQISVREFARRMGCSDTSVRKAIFSGKIVNGFNPETKTINPKVAALEWKENADPLTAQQTKTGKTVFEGKIIPSSKDAPRKFAKKVARKPPQPPQDEETDESDTQAPAPSATSTAAIKRQQAIYALKTAKIDYEKKAGELVNKDQVYSKLFEFGQEIRLAFQDVPSRCIDKVISADSRTEALGILRQEIDSVLLRLSKLESIQLNNRA